MVPGRKVGHLSFCSTGAMPYLPVFEKMMARLRTSYVLVAPKKLGRQVLE